MGLCHGGDECAQVQPWFRLQKSSAASPTLQAQRICLQAHTYANRRSLFHGRLCPTESLAIWFVPSRESNLKLGIFDKKYIRAGLLRSLHDKARVRIADIVIGESPLPD